MNPAPIVASEARGAFDPLPIARALVACRSVTGENDGGAQALIAQRLAALGFTVTHLPFGPPGRETPNLFARIGAGAPHVCFAGHTDVVPPGPDRGWSVDPFAAIVRDDTLFGRGACDMKGAIAAFIAATAAHLASRPADEAAHRAAEAAGTISLLITGDEEGDATDGTVRVVAWLAAHDLMPDFCLVGEPTNPSRLGETVKIGRRGSMNATIEVDGVQGHSAYPERADNPVHRLMPLLAELVARPLDDGTESFAPSSLQVTSVDVGNAARNVIPDRATALLNIRFNDLHTAEELGARLGAVAERHAPGRVRVRWTAGGHPFVTTSAREVGILSDAIMRVTGARPALDTGGGTSDARFLAPHCAVAEFGLVGASMHKADEHVPVRDLRALAAIYRTFLDDALRGAAR